MVSQGSCPYMRCWEEYLFPAGSQKSKLRMAEQARMAEERAQEAEKNVQQAKDYRQSYLDDIEGREHAVQQQKIIAKQIGLQCEGGEEDYIVLSLME